MRASHRTLFLLVAILTAPPVTAAALVEDPFDRRLIEELRARNPAAVETLLAGNAARQAGRHREAATFYARVRTMVPEFSHAWRREGSELIELQLRPDAIDRMRHAVALEDSSWNQVGLAAALIIVPVGTEPLPAEVDEAESLVRKAQVQEETPEAAQLGCMIAMRSNNRDWLGTEAALFERLAPGNPMAHAYDAVHRISTGDRSGALRALERARTLGLSEESYRGLKRSMESPFHRMVAVGSWVLGTWLAGLLVLLGMGSALSAATLRASNRLPSTPGGGPEGLEAVLRKAYRGVLAACCGYYFVSLPIVLASVLLLGGGLVYLLVSSGHIPVKLVLIIAALTLVTLWSVIKSVFARSRDEDPGLKLGPGEHPRLRSVLDEVAGCIGTRPVTNVYLTPGAEFAVMERGGMSRQLRGHTERCLILGVGGLEGMRLRPFRAVLAHEYGHFSNRDTAGGGFALAVRRSLMLTAFHLAKGGAAAWYNPAWLFVNGFHSIFLRISQGASRLQEVLADRWAAFGYGSRAFAEGLRHVIERSIRFDAHANRVLREVIEGEKPLTNIYRFSPAVAPNPERIEEAIEEAMTREPSPYDSHPRPVDRIQWVEALSAEGVPVMADDDRDAWTLFDDREALERRLTDELRQGVAMQHGYTIPKEEGAATPLEV